jgi:hypothetical protein
VADTPQFLTLAGDRDRSERYELALRRMFFGALTLVLESGGRMSFIPKSS